MEGSSFFKVSVGFRTFSHFQISPFNKLRLKAIVPFDFFLQPRLLRNNSFEKWPLKLKLIPHKRTEESYKILYRNIGEIKVKLFLQHQEGLSCRVASLMSVQKVMEIWNVNIHTSPGDPCGSDTEQWDSSSQVWWNRISSLLCVEFGVPEGAPDLAGTFQREGVPEGWSSGSNIISPGTRAGFCPGAPSSSVLSRELRQSILHLSVPNAPLFMANSLRPALYAAGIYDRNCFSSMGAPRGSLEQNTKQKTQ